MPEVVSARNQQKHEGFRMLTWRYCPLCGIQFKISNAYSFRDRWWMHLIADHKRSAEAARQLLEDCRPLGKGEWDPT